MTPAEYRTRYLAGLALSAPTQGETDEAQLQALLPGPHRLFGPDLPGEPLLLARRQALLAVLRGALPDPVEGMDLPGLAAWLQAGARLAELEVHLGHVERHEQQLDQERLRLLGEVEKLQHHLGHVERHEQQLDQERLRLQQDLGRLWARAEQDHRQIAELEAVRDSTSYHLGRTLLAPAALLRRLARRLGRKP